MPVLNSPFAAVKKKGRPKGSKMNPNSPRALAAKARRAVTPAVTPAVPPAVTPDAGAAISDVDLFGAAPNFDRPEPTPEPSAEPTPEPSAEPTPEPSAEPQSDPKPEPESTAESQRPLAMFVWDTIVAMLASIIGVFWLPRPCGKNPDAGEIPYDEREMVISAFCEYLHSIGVAIMNPAQKLWLAIGAYAAPRLLATVNWARSKFFKKKTKTSEATQPDSRQAKTENAG